MKAESHELEASDSGPPPGDETAAGRAESQAGKPQGSGFQEVAGVSDEASEVQQSWSGL